MAGARRRRDVPRRGRAPCCSSRCTRSRWPESPGTAATAATRGVGSSARRTSSRRRPSARSADAEATIARVRGIHERVHGWRGASSDVARRITMQSVRGSVSQAHGSGVRSSTTSRHSSTGKPWQSTITPGRMRTHGRSSSGRIDLQPADDAAAEVRPEHQLQQRDREHHRGREGVGVDELAVVELHALDRGGHEHLGIGGLVGAHVVSPCRVDSYWIAPASGPSGHRVHPTSNAQIRSSPGRPWQRAQPRSVGTASSMWPQSSRSSWPRMVISSRKPPVEGRPAAGRPRRRASRSSATSCTPRPGRRDLQRTHRDRHAAADPVVGQPLLGEDVEDRPKRREGVGPDGAGEPDREPVVGVGLVDDLDASREVVPRDRSAEPRPRLPGHVVDTGQVDVAAAEQLTQERGPVHVAHRRALVGADPVDHEAGRVALPLGFGRWSWWPWRSSRRVSPVLAVRVAALLSRSLRSQISRHAMGTPAAGS